MSGLQWDRRGRIVTCYGNKGYGKEMTRDKEGHTQCRYMWDIYAKGMVEEVSYGPEIKWERVGDKKGDLNWG